MSRVPLSDPILPQHAQMLREVHGALLAEPGGIEALDALGRWTVVLRSQNYNRMPADERLITALGNPDDNPTAWCFANGCALSGILALELCGRPRTGEGFSSLTTYALGRALMRGAAHAPRCTNGMSDTYELDFPLGWNGLAALAADEELTAAFNEIPDVQHEVAAEAARLASDPSRAVTGFDRSRTEAAITAAGSPVSLAACAQHRISDLPLDLPFARVIQVIGRSDPAFAAQLLDAIGNPAIVAAMLPDLGIVNVYDLVQLLRHSAIVFDECHAWTKRSAAWMVLILIERRLLRHIKSGPTSGPSLQALVDEVLAALDARTDGNRLGLEWLANMAGQLAQSITSPLGSPSDAMRRAAPVLELLSVVAERLRTSPWAFPARIWTLFGGGPLPSDATMTDWSKGAHGAQLPRWSDWLGKETAIGPAMVAVRLSSGDGDANLWLSRWVRWICQQIERDPSIRTLLNGEPAAAAAHLAWPLALLPDPAAVFGEIWKDAAWLRIQARFAKIEQAPELTTPVRALVQIGLCTFHWTTVAGGRDCSGFAGLLADCIDEARFALPEAGIANWPSLVGSLAGCMTRAGLLGESALAAFLARYDGDDDALVAACVNITANGIPVADVREALTAMGSDPAALAERWSQWHSRTRRDSDPSVFELALRALEQSA